MRVITAAVLNVKHQISNLKFAVGNFDLVPIVGYSRFHLFAFASL